MPRLAIVACCATLFLATPVGAEDADTLYKQGLSKLRDAQSDHAMLVPAVKLLAQAQALFEASGNEVKMAEVNSCLYWAKKKMTLADTETVKSESNTVQRLEAVSKVVAVSEAQAMLDKANVFASTHATDPLLVAIRYFEVGDRFKDADAGRNAIELSLKAMQKVGEKAALETYKPAPTDGSVFIKSEPPGAAIILRVGDGKMDTGKKTPSLIHLPVGRQSLEMTLKGFKTTPLAVDVDGKAIAKPDAVKLDPQTVPIDIIFEEGWTIFVDAKPAKSAGTGKTETPCTLELPLGTHELGLGKEGFSDIKQRLEIVDGGIKTGRETPQPKIEIKAKPSKGTGTLLNEVDFLAMIKPDRDVLRGQWATNKGGWTSDNSSKASIQIPFASPEEYDLRVDLERIGGDSSVLIFLRGPKGGQFYFSLGSYANKRAGFGDVKHKKIDNNAASVQHQLQNNRRYVVILQIRRNSMAAYVDGTLLVQYATDYSDISTASDWELSKTDAFGLGTFSGAFRFHEVKLTKISR